MRMGVMSKTRHLFVAHCFAMQHVGSACGVEEVDTVNKHTELAYDTNPSKWLQHNRQLCCCQKEEYSMQTVADRSSWIVEETLAPCSSKPLITHTPNTVLMYAGVFKVVREVGMQLGAPQMFSS